MKVLQVLNFSSSDGRYGGPQRVSESQIRGLRSIGVQSELLALTTREEASVTREELLFTARRLLGLNLFASMISPSALIWAIKSLRNFQLVHIHYSRDLFTNSIALLCLIMKVPFVLQTHGMLQNHNGLFRKIWDYALARPLILRAKRVLFLTDEERADHIKEFGLGQKLALRIVNGGRITSPEGHHPEQEQRDAILFASRLDPRKRPLVFAEFASKASRRYPDLVFRIAGPDAGSLEEVVDYLRKTSNPKIEYVGSLNAESLALEMQRAKALVLPALWDVFPMIMVEAACGGVPVIAVSGYETSDWFGRHQAAILCDGSVQGFLKALDVLEGNLSYWQTKSISFAKLHLDENIVAKQLLELYVQVLGETTSRK